MKTLIKVYSTIIFIIFSTTSCVLFATGVVVGAAIKSQEVEHLKRCEIDKKTGVVKIDGIEKYILKSSNFNNENSIYPINGNQELIFLEYRTIHHNYGYQYHNNAPTNATSRYVRIVFLPINQEIEISSRFLKDIILLLDNHNVIIGNELNHQGVGILLSKYGNSPYSGRNR